MQKRILAGVALVCLGLFGAFLAVPAAQAQQQQMEPSLYTYVAFWGVPRAQWGDIEKAYANSRPVLEKLVADGTLVSWGSSSAVVHDPSGMTHNNWFQASSMAGILKALDALQPTAQDPVFGNSKHFDFFLRTISHGGKAASLNSGYLVVFMWPVKPGENDAFEEIFRKYYKPLLDDGIARGSVTMYNFDVQEIHTDNPVWHYVAVVVPDAAAVDKLYASISGLIEGNAALGPAFGTLVDFAAHRDMLAHIISYQHK